MSRRLAAWAFASVLGASFGVLGCGGGNGRVVRVVDGRVVDGRFVEPEAYALFLRGAIAESNGALDEAVLAYEAVSRVDNGDPEVFARIARARCAREDRDPVARVALERAFALDADYGPAWAAAAACGSGEGPRERAARAEPRDVGIQVSFARALEQSSSGRANAVRERLLALTLEQPESSEALSALVSWADTHDDLDLLVLALGEALTRAPHLDATVAHAVVNLAGEGQTARARRVAAALLDTRARGGHAGSPIDEVSLTAVGRLAVDEAAERDDRAALERRSVAAHMTSAEAAARAALFGRSDLARGLALDTLRADPNDSGARMVLASVSSRDVRVALFDASTRVPPAPALACALFARTLWRTAGAAAARTMLRAASCNAVVGSDGPVISLLVDLAARDVVDDSTLPTEGRIELAWRKRAPLPLTAWVDLDSRHELLARAQSDPLSTRTAELAAKLARRGPTDAIVLAALVSVARARGETLDQVAREALKPPANAVLDAALIDALPKSAPESVRIRARFAGLAATAAERALAQ